MPFLLLLWLQIPVDDPQAVKVVQSQGQLSQVELDILLSEHDLGGGKGLRFSLSRLEKPGLFQSTHVEIPALPQHAPATPNVEGFSQLQAVL